MTNITGLHNVFNDDRGAGVVGIDSITDRFGKGRVPTLFAKVVEFGVENVLLDVSGFGFGIFALEFGNDRDGSGAFGQGSLYRMGRG